MDNDLLSDYLTVKELAAELKRSPRTIARWLSVDEAPPPTRIGRQIVFRREAVRSWLLDRETT